MKTYALIILLMLLSSCGIFKNRSVSTNIEKSEEISSEVLNSDSTKETHVSTSSETSKITDYENEIIILTDTGIIKISSGGEFVGKAKSVSIKSKGKTKENNKTSTNTAIKEQKTQQLKITKKTYYKAKVKEVKSKASLVGIILLSAFAVAIFLTARKLAIYHR